MSIKVYHLCHHQFNVTLPLEVIIKRFWFSFQLLQLAINSPQSQTEPRSACSVPKSLSSAGSMLFKSPMLEGQFCNSVLCASQKCPRSHIIMTTMYPGQNMRLPTRQVAGIIYLPGWIPKLHRVARQPLLSQPGCH